jgi:hypothetical protein
MMETKAYRDRLDQALNDQIQPGMNVWFAFTSITSIDKLVTKLFVFTPKVINTNPVKDSQSGT